jgi:hypothetical protein
MLDNKDKEISTDELWSTRKHEKNLGGGEIFRTRPHRPWEPPSLLYNGYRVSFPGVKRPGRGANHPPPSSAEVKERVELYLYSLYEPSWTVLELTLFLPYCPLICDAVLFGRWVPPKCLCLCETKKKVSLSKVTHLTVASFQFC